MKIAIGPSVLQSAGSASDGDPATPPGSFNLNGPGQCADGPARASTNPQSVSQLSCVAHAAVGANPTTPAQANAKASAHATLTITYTWVERLLALVGIRPRLAARVQIMCFADVNDGPNQATFALFITGGPGGAAPIPVHQRAYNFTRQAANPALIDVTKDGAGAGSVGNPGVFLDNDPPRIVTIRPGAYAVQFEINATATADGRVIVAPGVLLALSEA